MKRIMKTLDEIINRQDYVRVNKALVERANELAEIFANKFYELVGAWDEREDHYPPFLINVNGHEYCAKYNIRGNGIDKWTDGFRFVLFEWWNGDDRYCSKSLNCTQYGTEASYYDYVNFLNDAKDILAKLDESETKMVKDAENAIENSKNISL